ncbi:carboxylesterase/lipase family protein [Ilumatobacter sp.]|uniref:carboxylesterase/lipase family protein n=1 Tax=Ilumatobacter sp. TaxID=1967498 RepID=UPI003B52211F
MTGTDLGGIDRGASREFRGIRFATAERFEPPVDVEAVVSVDDGTRFGPQAPQVAGALERMLGSSELAASEDCLFLNVFTPACDGARRPVMVWIHGGAFVTGTAAIPWYDGAPLAERGDIVVVTVNYRLGALGFLGSRNLGTLDQISALRWVRRHVTDFGGDPDRVTVVGESAGGSAALSLLAAPTADDLVHAVWAMSPSILQLRTREQGERLERSFLDLLGGDDPRTATVEAILDAQLRFPMATAGMRNFAPTEGTDALPDPVLERAGGDQRPLVIGTNRDEMLLFTAFDPTRAGWGDSDVEREFAARLGERAAVAIETYRRRRPGESASGLVSAMQTDEVFRRPAQRIGEARARSGVATWMYLFDQVSTAFGGILGACHGLDIPYAFDTLSSQGAETLTGADARRQEVADDFAGSVVAFVRDADPGWAAFDLDRRATRRIGPDPEVVDDPEPELRRLWD